MKYIYLFLAEVICFIHGLIFFFGLTFGFFWQELFLYYIVMFPVGASSWIFFKRCLLTDFENWLRVKAGQDMSHIRGSFLGYWGTIIFGRHGPSNTTIMRIIFGFYIVITPIWLYAIYVEYFL